MTWTWAVLTPKESYSLADHAEADEILVRRKLIEPRCNVDSAICLRLRAQGPFVRYTGDGSDLGKSLELAFLNKPDGKLRLAYVSPKGFIDPVELGRIVGRTIRDALQAGATAVYWYSRDDDPDNGDKRLMRALGTRLGEVFPSISVSQRRANGFTIWEATQT